MKAAIMLFCLTFCVLPAFADAPPCVVLASHEPAKGIAAWSAEGRAEKHMLTYLAGGFPDGIKFRSEIKDKEVD